MRYRSRNQPAHPLGVSPVSFIKPLLLAVLAAVIGFKIAAKLPF